MGTYIVVVGSLLDKAVVIINKSYFIELTCLQLNLIDGCLLQGQLGRTWTPLAQMMLMLSDAAIFTICNIQSMFDDNLC